MSPSCSSRPRVRRRTRRGAALPGPRSTYASHSNLRTSSASWRGALARTRGPAEMSDDNAFAELIHEYVAECLPLAERVAEALLATERLWGAGNREGDEIDALKGTLHTIKGNSAMMGLAPMQEVAHALEDLCARAVANPAEREAELAGLLVEGSGLLA